MKVAPGRATMEPMRTALLLVALCLAVLAPPSLAGTDAHAERRRLREEMMDLAARNAWKGVDRQYQRLVSEELDPEPSDHLLGAQAASQLGRADVAVARLEAAVQDQADTDEQRAALEQARAQLEDILQRYGKVSIAVGPRRVAGLVRFDLPFGTEERETIQAAREKLLAERVYRGLLPLGEYMIDGVKFEVTRSDAWQEIKVE